METTRSDGVMLSWRCLQRLNWGAAALSLTSHSSHCLGDLDSQNETFKELAETADIARYFQSKREINQQICVSGLVCHSVSRQRSGVSIGWKELGVLEKHYFNHPHVICSATEEARCLLCRNKKYERIKTRRTISRWTRNGQTDDLKSERDLKCGDSALNH